MSHTWFSGAGRAPPKQKLDGEQRRVPGPLPETAPDTQSEGLRAAGWQQHSFQHKQGLRWGLPPVRAFPKFPSLQQRSWPAPLGLTHSHSRSWQCCLHTWKSPATPGPALPRFGARTVGCKENLRNHGASAIKSQSPAPPPHRLPCKYLNQGPLGCLSLCGSPPVFLLGLWFFLICQCASSRAVFQSLPVEYH